MYLRNFYPMLPIGILGLLLGSPFILWPTAHLDSGNKMLVAFGLCLFLGAILFTVAVFARTNSPAGTAALCDFNDGTASP
jgi:hypothetical protein